jgi:hypothetical protein
LFNVIAIRSSGNGYIKHRVEITLNERKCVRLRNRTTAAENEGRNKGKETTETKEGKRREGKKDTQTFT